VATEKGRGTTFVMIIPAALSLVNCVMVRCCDQVFAIDATNVQDGRRQQLRNNGGGPLDAQELPLLRLSELINQSTTAAGDTDYIVWRPSDSARPDGLKGYRIAVDEIITTHETLVRGLGRHAYRWPGVCGAAEMFDGRVALVLDLAELIENASETMAE